MQNKSRLIQNAERNILESPMSVNYKSKKLEASLNSVYNHQSPSYMKMQADLDGIPFQKR